MSFIPKNRVRPCILLASGWHDSAIHRGIAKFARQAGWILDMSMTRHGVAPSSWKGDGIISILHQDSNLYELLRTTSAPVVNIGDVNLKNLPTVSPDNRAIGKMAAEYFAERGFENYAFFLRSNAPSGKMKAESFSKTIQRLGHSCHLIDWPTQCRMPNVTRFDRSKNSLPSDELEMLTWLSKELVKLPKPLALFTEHDDSACELLYACIKKNILVPEQASILGTGNDELRCEFAPVPLSSISEDREMIGYEAAVLLDKLLRGEKGLDTRVLVSPTPGIITRQSSDMMAVKHPQVASALGFIWKNYKERINAKTTAATVNISYRQLHDAFLSSIGKTIAAEITWKRLEHAMDLLKNSKKTTAEISRESGFPNEDRMGRVFKRVLHVTPFAYRRQFRKIQ